MDINLKAGDEVFVNSTVEPKLSLIITQIVTETDQLMACGEYGCSAVNLLVKTDPAAITKTDDLKL